MLRVPGWVTVAYVPQVWANFHKCFAVNAARPRAQVLEHTLNWAFRDLRRASHFGVNVTMSDGTKGVGSPRVGLYVRDQPEYRDILC